MPTPPAAPDAGRNPKGTTTPPGFFARLPPPPAIPDHELLELIGRGSYGQVWLARSRLGTMRAVKIVSREAFEDRKPFEREFKGIQRFEPVSRTHEGLVDILQVGVTDDYFYYVMELADDCQEMQKEECKMQKAVALTKGRDQSNSAFRLPPSYFPRTLRVEQQRLGRLPVAECVRIGRVLASALAHLHRHNLVHRDVKPSNIIFVEGQPKLADIGLVADMSEARSYVGTEGFVPPEGPGTPKADLYSLGKVLYEISTGKDRRDFPAWPDELASEPNAGKGDAGSSSDSALLTPHSASEAAFLELNAVIVKACQADPDQRYASAEAMEVDLAMLEQGRSVRRKRSRERTWAVARITSLITVALLVTTVALMQFSRWLRNSGRPATAEEASIFILPFRHSAPGPLRRESWELEQDVCFCGRLTDAFIGGLALAPGIRTGPRKSGWIRYDEDDIRHALVRTNSARYILTGRLDHTNDTLRLALRLYERQKESPIWTENLVRTTNDVVALEQQAIAAVARRLDRPIAEEVQRQINQTLSNNLAAYGLFHRARLRYLSGFSADFHQALADYTAALDADPNYTAAYVGIMWLRGEIGFEQPPRSVQPEICNRANQLLALDDTVFLAHTRIVYRLLYYDYDWDSALKYITWMRAVWPEEHLEQAIWMRTLGRTNEARIHHERLKLLPNPGFMELTFIAYGECVWRQYDAALAAAERFGARYPDSPPFLLGCVQLQAGNYSKAIEHLKKAAGPGPGPSLLGLLGRAYALAGDRTNALDMLRQLEPRVVAGDADPYYLAWIQAGLGRKAEALLSLEKAVDYKSIYITHSEFGGLRTDPAWDEFRDDPRFEAICQKVGMGKDQWPK
jgi:serine/threonine protein kinase